MPVEQRPDPEYRGGSIYCSSTAAFLIRLKKYTTETGCFSVENDGVYIETAHAKNIYSMNPKGNPFDNSVFWYDMLQKYCGLKLSKENKEDIQKEQDRRKAIQDSIEIADLLKNAPKPTEEQKKRNEENKARVEEHRKKMKAKADTSSNEQIKKRLR